jgi:hypothetical protein
VLNPHTAALADYDRRLRLSRGDKTAPRSAVISLHRHSEPSEPEGAKFEPQRTPLDWVKLSERGEPPSRRWAIKGWFGFGHVTLLVGSGGIGKTLIAQQAASALALGRNFIDEVPGPLKVLMWAAEDDHDELWRRQIDIAKWMDAPLTEFDENLIIEPRAGRDNTIITTNYGSLILTSVLQELREQANDCHAEAVVIDNAAQTFGASENDRHAVTFYLNALVGALPGKAILLLAHPARSAGSEFSGSSAWENCARTRLYLGEKLPGEKVEEGEEPADNVRFLARRKANYSPKDWRRFQYRDGVLSPDAIEQGDSGVIAYARAERAKSVIRAGLQTLTARSIRATSGTGSRAYLPRVLLEYKLADGCAKNELASSLRAMILAGEIDTAVIGRYENRSPMSGLRLKS